MKLLVHACCAWCLGKCLPGLAREGLGAEETTVFWNNPNIHPLIEYRRRLKAVKMLCERAELALSEGREEGEEREGYGLVEFCRAIHGREDVPERCAACYGMRLRRTARAAKEGGFDAFSTTLLTSLQQNHALLKSAGKAAAEEFGVEFFYRDWRGETADERLTKWLYKQSYCGCVFSEYDRYRGTTAHLWPPGGLIGVGGLRIHQARRFKLAESMLARASSSSYLPRIMADGWCRRPTGKQTDKKGSSMNSFVKRICILAIAATAVAASVLPVQAEGLVTQGSSELGIGGTFDFTSAVGTDLALDVRYSYFFWDRISLGGVGGFSHNDAASGIKAGFVGEYNFALPEGYEPLIGTDFVPFIGAGLSYQYVDVYHEHESALVLTTEGGVKFFLTDSAAVTLSAIFDLATEDIFPDDNDANKWNVAFRLGMRFYF